MQQKTKNITREAAKTRLQINLEKTETMSMNKKQQKPITLGDKELKEVDSFTYLGRTGGSDDDI
ncbi:hypothetical protein DPMN_118021 [Dreissena polymorpha]|uniref:Uncharacterized protein n=1 Tax=Dreissena polymorpha TaxID=45954 RepID=A0A9D4GG46_DREPO|nr:hypothetical protein DPMN_118021 [Dreissena polymorpha]